MKKKVLVVDDAAFVRMVLIKTIEALGHTVIGEAVDGEDAVKKAKELQPDVILLDIVMPKMDGIEAVKQIKKEFPNMPVIMISAMGQKKMVIDAIVAGAKDFIVKPFQQERVAKALLG